MIYKKSWDKRKGGYGYKYTGWFLLGFIPLYVRRDKVYW